MPRINRQNGPRIVATLSYDDSELGQAGPLADSFSVVVEVPALL